MKALTLLRQSDGSSLAFMLVTFLTGAGVALQFSTLSLFLANDVHVNPLMIGIFYTANAIAGIFISQWLAHRSDHSLERKQLIVFCCFAGVALCVLFALNRNYWILLLLGVILSSIASTASPQLFALAREHAIEQQKRSEMFTTIMRAQFSLAWVIGPPIAFAIAISYGFKALYLIAALTFLLCALVVIMQLPKGPARQICAPHVKLKAWENRDVRMLIIGSTLMWTCNSMYLIGMPLYVTRTLHLEEHLAGIMMGTAACLEIPAMLISGYYTRKIGKRPMMLLAAIAGILFYSSLLWFDSSLTLIAIQLFNAVFIGILASIGMCYFQDLLAHAPGGATTLYSNTIKTGTIIGGAISGLVAQWLGFQAVFAVALFLVTISLLCYWRVTNV